MPTIRRVLETALYCDDLAGTAKFYREVLGLAVHFADDRLAAFDASGATVLLLFKRGASSEGVSFPGGFIPARWGRAGAHRVRGRCGFARGLAAAAGGRRRRDRKPSSMGARRPQPLLPRSRGALGRAGDTRRVADVLDARGWKEDVVVQNQGPLGTAWASLARARVRRFLSLWTIHLGAALLDRHGA